MRSQASLLDDVETYATYDGESVDVRFNAPSRPPSPAEGGASHLFDDHAPPKVAAPAMVPTNAPAPQNTQQAQPTHLNVSQNRDAHEREERERMLAERERILAERERAFDEREHADRATQRAVTVREYARQEPEAHAAISRTASVNSLSTALLSNKASTLSRPPSAHPSASPLAVSVPVGPHENVPTELSSPLTPPVDTPGGTQPAISTEALVPDPSSQSLFNAPLPAGEPNSRGLIRRAQGTRRVSDKAKPAAVSPRRSQRRRGA